MLKPWTLIDRERAVLLEAELAREMRPDHPLAGVPCEAVAMSTMTDDVLFITDSADGPLALVHLTWSGKPDQFPNYPSTCFYPEWESFRNEEMLPMHENLSE
jgi:hypothetical protein